MDRLDEIENRLVYDFNDYLISNHICINELMIRDIKNYFINAGSILTSYQSTRIDELDALDYLRRLKSELYECLKISMRHVTSRIVIDKIFPTIEELITRASVNIEEVMYSLQFIKDSNDELSDNSVTAEMLDERYI